MTEQTILILGGGASGLAAAIESARLGLQPVVLERMDRIGKKILATGNGRCNLLNLHADGTQYNHPEFAAAVLNAVDVESNLLFFRSMGLVTTADREGRVYPRTMAASSVLDVLRLECARLGVQIRTGVCVQSIRRQGGSFVVNDTLSARAVIVACGGKAAPAQGANGSGYPLLQSLGHTLTPLRPALVQIRTQTDRIRPLKGLRTSAALTLHTPDGQSFNSAGEILFTDSGISGIAAMDLSRHAAEGSTLTLDILPDLSAEETIQYLRMQRDSDPQRPLEFFLSGLCQSRIGQTILRLSLHSDLNGCCGSLHDKQLSALCDTLKGFRLTVTGTKGFADAQVTAGGISCAEFNTRLASRKVDGLFACGEILDIDGLCGGFNLMFAWSSGRLAARSAADYLKKAEAQR